METLQVQIASFGEELFAPLFDQCSALETGAQGDGGY